MKNKNKKWKCLLIKIILGHSKEMYGRTANVVFCRGCNDYVLTNPGLRKRILQVIMQLLIWIIAMLIDFALTGHVLIGGFLGATLGLLLVVYWNLFKKHE